MTDLWHGARETVMASAPRRGRAPSGQALAETYHLYWLRIMGAVEVDARYDMHLHLSYEERA